AARQTRDIRGGTASVNDRSELLEQLRIARDDPSPSGGGRRWLLGVGAALALIAVAAGAWYAYGPANRIPVSVAVAEPVVLDGAAAPRGSILDASGYVVARRQATVSAKITGKVVEVLIEEGQRVEQGQVIARLDSANALAALAQAQAQHAQAVASLNAA